MDKLCHAKLAQPFESNAAALPKFPRLAESMTGPTPVQLDVGETVLLHMRAMLHCHSVCNMCNSVIVCHGCANCSTRC
jgi:hypothetical protein